jgi:hypothetical protein
MPLQPQSARRGARRALLEIGTARRTTQHRALLEHSPSGRRPLRAIGNNAALAATGRTIDGPQSAQQSKCSIKTRFSQGWLLLLMAVASLQSWAAQLDASVDRRELAIDEYVLLTLSLTNSDTRLRAEGINPNVDLSLVTGDFAVGTPRDSHRYNISRGEGRSTSELQVELFPKHVGTVVVPAFEIDGLQTTPIHLTVHPSAQADAPLAFSETGVSKAQVWDSEHLVAYLDIYTRVELESAQLGADLATEPEPIDVYNYQRLPQQQRSEQRHGFSYHVVRSAWTLFPHDTVALTLQWPETWLVTKTGQRFRLPGAQRRVDVLPLPSTVPQPVLVGKPSVSVAPVRNGTHANDLFAWEWTLRASAPATLIPQDLSVVAPPGMQLYIDRPRIERRHDGEGVEEVAHYMMSVFPLVAGRHRVPDITVPYFDPDTATLQTLRVSGPAFEVAAGAATNAAVAAATPPHASTATKDRASAWMIASATFASLWIATLALWWQQRRAGGSPLPPPAPLPRPARSSRPLEARLLSAFNATSLSTGLQNFQRAHGDNAQIQEAVVAVQQLYYSERRERDADCIKPLVEQAISLIERAQASTQSVADHWSPDPLARIRSTDK